MLEVLDTVADLTVKQFENHMRSVDNNDSSLAAAQLTVRQEEVVVRVDTIGSLIKTRGGFSVEDDPVDPKGAQG